MPTPLDILIGVVLPAALCALILLGVRRAAWGPSAGAALAAGAGCVAAHLLQRGWRGFPPGESTDWAWVAAAGGAVVGLVAPLLGDRLGRRLLVRGVAAECVAVLALRAWRDGEGQSSLRWAALAAAFAAAVVWTAAERRERTPGWFAPLVLALTAAGAATAIGMSGSAKLALLAGGVCGVLCAAATAGALRLAPPTLEGVAGPCVLALTVLVLVARFYSELPASSAWLVAAAPGVVLVPRALLQRRGVERVTLGSLVVAVALLGLAVKLAVDASPSWEGLGY